MPIILNISQRSKLDKKHNSLYSASRIQFQSTPSPTPSRSASGSDKHGLMIVLMFCVPKLWCSILQRNSKSWRLRRALRIQQSKSLQDVQDQYLTRMREIASHVKSAIRAKGHPHDGAAGTKAHIGHSILPSCPNQTTEMYGQSNSTRSVQKRKVLSQHPERKDVKRLVHALPLSNTWKRQHFNVVEIGKNPSKVENPNSPHSHHGPQESIAVPPCFSFTVCWRQKQPTSS